MRGNEDYLKALLLFTNIFINSSTMMHTVLLKKIMYRKGYEPAEDYDLFERIVAEYKFGIINNLLCCYRIHDNNVSTIKSYNCKISERNIIERQLKKYVFEYTNDDLDIHLKFTTGEFDFLKTADCVLWFKSLAEQNSHKKIFNKESFNMALARQWLRFCLYRLKTKRDINPFFEKGTIKYSHLIGSFLKSI